MNIPQEFEDVFHGVELTEDEIRTLTWVTGWEHRTVENLRSAIQKAQATALSTLQAENSRLRAELEYEREHADAYYEECGQWQAENEKLLAENIRWGQVASEQDKAIDNLSKELEWKDMVIELAQRKQQEAEAALRREQKADV